MFENDDRLNKAAEQCAKLETWLKLETDPDKREQIESALKEAQHKLAKEMERVAQERGMDSGRMFPDGNVTDFLKKMDERAATAKEAGEAKQAAQEAAAEKEPSPAEVERETMEVVRELVRELEVPAEIQSLPEWPPAYEATAAEYESSIAGAAQVDGPAFDNDRVPELQPGADVAGTVERIEHSEDVTAYIVRDDDGALTALHDDARNPQFPDLEEGDSITASREQDGEYSVSYDHDYGL